MSLPWVRLDSHIGAPAPLDPERIMPLGEFSPEHRARIQALVDLPYPPEQWLPCGVDEPGRKPLGYIPNRAWYEWHWQRGRQPQYRPVRPPIPAHVRAAVLERDGHVCLHCGTTENLSMDHVIPWSLGGPDTEDNLQTLCRSCNSKKGARV